MLVKQSKEKSEEIKEHTSTYVDASKNYKWEKVGV